jgi:hypothetical protein
MKKGHDAHSVKTHQFYEEANMARSYKITVNVVTRQYLSFQHSS